MVPTTRPRFQVTETPSVERALKVAAEEWPEASRAELVVKLFERGARSLEASRAERVARRLKAIKESSGSLSDAYHPGYLEELRRDWPD